MEACFAFGKPKIQHIKAKFKVNAIFIRWWFQIIETILKRYLESVINILMRFELNPVEQGTKLIITRAMQLLKCKYIASIWLNRQDGHLWNPNKMERNTGWTHAAHTNAHASHSCVMWRPIHLDISSYVSVTFALFAEIKSNWLHNLTVEIWMTANSNSIHTEYICQSKFLPNQSLLTVNWFN